MTIPLSVHSQVFLPQPAIIVLIPALILFSPSLKVQLTVQPTCCHLSHSGFQPYSTRNHSFLLRLALLHLLWLQPPYSQNARPERKNNLSFRSLNYFMYIILLFIYYYCIPFYAFVFIQILVFSISTIITHWIVLLCLYCIPYKFPHIVKLIK